MEEQFILYFLFTALLSSLAVQSDKYPSSPPSSMHVQRLENTLYLMMFVLSFGFYIKIHPGSITQGFEEVQEHFL